MVPAYGGRGGGVQPPEPAERRDHPWVVVATAHPAKFNEIVEPIIGKPVTVPPSLERLLRLPQHAVDLPPTLDALAAAIA